MSPQAIANGKRVSQLCKGGTFTKGQIQSRLSLSPYEAQQAIDWCKQERLIARNPFYAVIEHGEWTYGYRSTLIDVVEHSLFNLGYCATRLGNEIADLEHELLTTASLSKRISSKQRVTMNTDLAMLKGAVATIARVRSDVVSLLP